MVMLRNEEKNQVTCPEKTKERFFLVIGTFQGSEHKRDQLFKLSS